MVVKKKLDNEFRGFQVPYIPRFPRSARRSPSKKPTEDGKASAFDILASLAGKLLLEGESSASSNASKVNHQAAISQGDVDLEVQDEVKPLAVEGIHYAECVSLTEVGSQKRSQKHLEHPETDPKCVSGTNNSDSWEKLEAEVKSEIFKLENKFGHKSSRLAEGPEEFSDGNIKSGFKLEHEVGSSGSKGSSLDNKCSATDRLELCVNSPAPIDSNSNVKCCRELFPNASLLHGHDIKLCFRDDDEKLLRCKKVCTKTKPYRPPRHIARCKIRKTVAYKYWKAAPKLKDFEHSRSEEGGKPLYHKRKTYYSFERSQHDTPFKRREFYDQGSVVTSDGGFSSESVSNLPEKEMDGDNPGSSAKSHASEDSHVKFSIKSFKIPKLYIDVPETATVGSLKRTVMEAAMAILGSDVRVGVLVQGKKVRDDSRTLLQTGLSCKGKMDKLGFTLEPSAIQAPPTVCVDNPSQCKTSQPIRSSGTPIVDSGTNDALHDSTLLTNTANLVKSNYEPIPYSTDTIADKITPDSRVLVALPARSTEALAVVPLSQKTRCPYLVQRRTRRPFSVSEVEALVQAIEELGTGRWRDVKLRAFENADHRTYVDLKDKWKTLVHTAKISPQQRRGEPVPEDLLNRVLTAHAYWTHHQSKQQHGGKHQQGVTMKNSEASAERQQCWWQHPTIPCEYVEKKID